MGHHGSSSAVAKAMIAPTARAVQIAPVLTGSQIRAARALLRWSAKDLADRCGLSYAAIQRAEKVDDMPNMMSRNLATLKAAFEDGGVIFLNPGDTRDGGHGVRMR